jgi:hypothetical protein
MVTTTHSNGREWAMFIGHRQLVASSQLNLGDRQRVDNLLPADTADFSPDLEFLGPGCSVLGGSDMITA